MGKIFQTFPAPLSPSLRSLRCRHKYLPSGAYHERCILLRHCRVTKAAAVLSPTSRMFIKFYTFYEILSTRLSPLPEAFETLPVCSVRLTYRVAVTECEPFLTTHCFVAHIYCIASGKPWAPDGFLSIN